MNRLDPAALRARLNRAGARAQHSYGQHFLVDGSVLETILQVAKLEKGEQVVEVGPGLGVLSEVLLAAGVKLTTFEADENMVKVLAEDFPKLKVVQGDAVQQLVAHGLKAPYKVVANIPYQITTPLLRVFLEGGVPAPVSLTLLMQREVGQRLAAPAKTGERGYLSVLAQYFAEVREVRRVPRTAFYPEPRVESAVVYMAVKAERPLPQSQERDFFAYVKARFLEPRKQFKNVISGMRGCSPAEAQELLAGCGLPATVRAQELSEQDWLNLYAKRV